MKYAEDMVFVFEYLKYCESFEFINEALYRYNVNPDNATYVVKNGFDVQRFIYEYQTRYFENAFFKDDILNEITPLTRRLLTEVFRQDINMLSVFSQAIFTICI